MLSCYGALKKSFHLSELDMYSDTINSLSQRQSRIVWVRVSLYLQWTNDTIKSLTHIVWVCLSLSNLSGNQVVELNVRSQTSEPAGLRGLLVISFKHVWHDLVSGAIVRVKI